MHSEDLAKVIHEMHVKGLYKEMVLLLDTCEALSLFDHVKAPNVYMIGSAQHHESALATEYDGALNNFSSDNFSRDMIEFLYSPVGYRSNRNYSLEDFHKYFTFEMIKSHVSVVNTSTRPMSTVSLKEFIPIDDITLGDGIDDKQESTKFYTWDDLLQ